MITADTRVSSRSKRGGQASRPAGSALSSIDDRLVFEYTEAGFNLIGGTGRGVGWAGIVEVGPGAESLVGRAWQDGRLIRHDGSRPAQIVGPYYARHAVAVPVGERYVVVFGADGPITLRDAEVVRLAAATVDQTHGVPADKLLADELELVHVLRALMAYRPNKVRDTMRHIATVAAGALSCEVAMIRVEHLGDQLVETLGFDGPLEFDARAERFMAMATGAPAPIVEQATAPGTATLGIDVASQLTLSLGSDPALGALALGHLVSSPRGFTSLCLRIGRAVAEAAELLITQASAREQLAAERDLLARISGTDALTGIANRRTWDEAAVGFAASANPPAAHVMSCDLDGLKVANDRYGHSAGDALIRATANLLMSCVREGDLVARMGGDEFAVLLRDTDATASRGVRARIRRAERVWRITEHGLTPRLSLGLVAVVGRDIESARHRADILMYANKRRRSRTATLKIASQPPDRRRSAWGHGRGNPGADTRT